MTKTEYCVSAEEVMALLDGELSAADARVVSAHVEQCSECALVMEQLRGVSETFSQWSVPEVPRAVEEIVEERLEKISSRPGMMRVRFSPRNLLAAGGVVAMVIALLIVVVAHAPYRRSRMMSPGALAEGERAQTDASKHLPEDGQVLYEQMGRAQSVDKFKGGGLEQLGTGPMADRKAAAGVAGMSEASTEGKARAVNIDGQLMDTTQMPAPMIARTMSLTIMVKDVESARASLDSVLARHKGYSAQLNISSPESGARNMRASLRVPEPELNSTAAEIKALGRTVIEMQSGEEVSQQHADLVARLKTSRETETRFQAILQQRTGKLSDVLEVEQNIARVRGEIEAMEAEQKALEHRVDFATLEVQLVEEYKAKLESPAENSVSTRMHNAFVAGYRNATETLLGIVLFAEEYGPPILIWLAILGIPAVVIWRRYRRIRSGLDQNG